MTTALVVVDAQVDFTTGSLAVPGGPQAAVNIANYIKANEGRATDTMPKQYDYKVATKDWHIAPGTHWAPKGTDPDFVETWPVHCKVGTKGADFDPALEGIAFDAVFKKGEYEACYSGFEGTAPERIYRTGDESVYVDVDITLHDWLEMMEVDNLIVCGIATDYCVKATVLDALSLDYAVTVPLRLCAGVAEDSTKAAVEEMQKAGALVTVTLPVGK